MKKIYIPTEDELRQMQDLSNGSYIYKYMLCKAIEVLIMEGKLEPEKGILERTNKWFKENPQIAVGICRMYPQEIPHSQCAENDIELCKYIASGGLMPDETIYTLDNLTYFQNGVGVYTNYWVCAATIETLAKKLPITPKYRFEYREPNELLDSIFSCELSSYDFHSVTAKQLASIEPGHILRLNKSLFDEYKQDSLVRTLKTSFGGFINQYSGRYGMEHQVFPEYFRKDILTEPDDNVKRLIRCLDRHKRKYQ